MDTGTVSKSDFGGIIQNVPYAFVQEKLIMYWSSCTVQVNSTYNSTIRVYVYIRLVADKTPALKHPLILAIRGLGNRGCIRLLRLQRSGSTICEQSRAYLSVSDSSPSINVGGTMYTVIVLYNSRTVRPSLSISLDLGFLPYPHPHPHLGRTIKGHL
jgi:hypothetical protein